MPILVYIRAHCNDMTWYDHMFGKYTPYNQIEYIKMKNLSQPCETYRYVVNIQLYNNQRNITTLHIENACLYIYINMYTYIILYTVYMYTWHMTYKALPIPVAIRDYSHRLPSQKDRLRHLPQSQSQSSQGGAPPVMWMLVYNPMATSSIYLP